MLYLRRFCTLAYPFFLRLRTPARCRRALYAAEEKRCVCRSLLYHRGTVRARGRRQSVCDALLYGERMSEREYIGCGILLVSVILTELSGTLLVKKHATDTAAVPGSGTEEKESEAEQ